MFLKKLFFFLMKAKCRGSRTSSWFKVRNRQEQGLTTGLATTGNTKGLGAVMHDINYFLVIGPIA